MITATTPIPMAMLIVEVISDIGITMVMSHFFKAVGPKPANICAKLLVACGEAAIIGMVCDKANKSMEDEMDELVSLYKQVKGKEVTNE